MDDLAYREPVEFWRQVLTGENPKLREGSRWHAILPADPRCYLCRAPFRGPGGWLMKAMRRGPSSKNPNFCSICVDVFEEVKAIGADIEISILFADVRGSTQLSETLSPTEYGALMNRYFGAAFRAMVPSLALVDKLVGDQVVGLFVPGFAGQDHARKAVEAARAVLRATGHGDGQPWVPVGAGVHTGVAYVSIRGAEAGHPDIWATGEAMNTAARLSSEAAAGEILVSEAAFGRAGMPDEGVERRHLPLKGLSQPVQVRVLRVGQAVPATA